MRYLYLLPVLFLFGCNTGTQFPMKRDNCTFEAYLNEGASDLHVKETYIGSGSLDRRYFLLEIRDHGIVDNGERYVLIQTTKSTELIKLKDKE
jgi:hypothetical protein